MLAYNEIKPKSLIILDGEPYIVLDSHVFRKQQRKPVNQTKLKNLKTGKVTEKSFHQSESAVEANLEKKHVTYLFSKFDRQKNIQEYWFSEAGNPAARFFIPEESLGINPMFLKQNTDVDLLMFDGDIIGITLPIKMSFKITEAPPSTKGNTAQGGTKQVTLENGAIVNAPLFVDTGDTIIVNTETGDYVSRA